MDLEVLQPFLLPVVGCIATYIMLVKKLEFELTQLRKDTDRQESKIQENTQAILHVKENGSMHSSHLDKRVEKMEEEFVNMKTSIDDIKHKMTESNAAMVEVKSALQDIKSFMNTNIERRMQKGRRG
jgi:chromosome segregation ATPase